MVTTRDSVHVLLLCLSPSGWSCDKGKGKLLRCVGNEPKLIMTGARVENILDPLRERERVG